MDENKVVEASDSINKVFTLTLSIKKLFVIVITTMTVISSTVVPLLYKQHTSRVEFVKQEVTLQFKFKLEELEYKLQQSERSRIQFPAIISQFEDTIEFFKIDKSYSRAYIKFSEKPTKANLEEYHKYVFKYAEFIKNKKTHPNSTGELSFYLSGQSFYLGGVSYIIPFDVLTALNDLK